MTNGNKTRNRIGTISLGLVIIFIQIFLLTQADFLFPNNTDQMRTILIVYMSITGLVFSVNTLTNRAVERPLFRVSFFKELITKFLPALIITGAILFGLAYITNPESLPTISGAIAIIGIGAILLHVFVVSIDEELIFRAFLVDELRANKFKKTFILWTQAIIFAFFHVALAGGNFLLLIPYVPLGVILLLVRDKFSPQTNMANAGVHAGWNLFILGFLRFV